MRILPSAPLKRRLGPRAVGVPEICSDSVRPGPARVSGRALPLRPSFRDQDSSAVAGWIDKVPASLLEKRRDSRRRERLLK